VRYSNAAWSQGISVMAEGPAPPAAARSTRWRVTRALSVSARGYRQARGLGDRIDRIAQMPHRDRGLVRALHEQPGGVRRPPQPVVAVLLLPRDEVGDAPGDGARVGARRGGLGCRLGRGCRFGRLDGGCRPGDLDIASGPGSSCGIPLIRVAPILPGDPTPGGTVRRRDDHGVHRRPGDEAAVRAHPGVDDRPGHVEATRGERGRGSIRVQVNRPQGTVQRERGGAALGVDVEADDATGPLPGALTQRALGVAQRLGGLRLLGIGQVVEAVRAFRVARLVWARALVGFLPLGPARAPVDVRASAGIDVSVERPRVGDDALDVGVRLPQIAQPQGEPGILRARGAQEQGAGSVSDHARAARGAEPEPLGAGLESGERVTRIGHGLNGIPPPPTPAARRSGSSQATTASTTPTTLVSIDRAPSRVPASTTSTPSR
jgi:hypothetical protein